MGLEPTLDRFEDDLLTISEGTLCYATKQFLNLAPHDGIEPPKQELWRFLDVPVIR